MPRQRVKATAEMDPTAVAIQLIETRIAILTHCTALRTVTDKLAAGDTRGAVKVLGRAVSALERVSLKHAVQAGYKPAKKGKVRRGK